MKRYSTLLLILIFASCLQGQNPLFTDTILNDSGNKFYHEIHSADFNDDNYLDIVATRITDGKFHTDIYLKDTGKFLLRSDVIPPSDTISYQLADMNNDNKIDIISVGKVSVDSICLMVYTQTAIARFSLSFKYLLSSFGKIVIEDFNNDGAKDIFVNSKAANSEYATMLMNDNSSFVNTKIKIPFLENASFASFDFDANSRKDLYVSGKDKDGKASSRVYINNKMEFVNLKIKLSSYLDGITARGDFNMDGNSDVFMTGTDSFGVRSSKIILFPSGSEIQLPQIPVLINGKAELMDINHDGLTDILVHGEKSDGNFVSGYLLQGDLQFYTLELSTVKHSMGFSDFDNNGNPDFILSIAGEDTITKILYNHATPNPGPIPQGELLAISFDTLLFLSWDIQKDEITPVAAIKYDVFFTSNGMTYSSPEASLNTGKRFVRQEGSDGNLNSVIFENYSEGNNNIAGVISIDNAFNSFFIDYGTGGASGSCPFLCAQITKGNLSKIDTTICEAVEKVLTSPTGLPATWYSNTRGLIGKSISITLKLESDERIFSLQNSMENIDKSFVLNVIFSKPVKFDLGEDRTVCIDKPITFDSLAKNNISWRINNKEFPNYDWKNVTDARSEKVNVVAIANNSCFLSDTIIVTILPLPEIRISMEKVSQGVELYVTGGSSYQWQNAELASVSSDPRVQVAPGKPTTYLVSGTDNNGCINKDSILVDAVSSVFVPTLFSPNNDGNNDVFEIYGENLKGISLKIRDRNGSIIFKSGNENHRMMWDGNVNDAPMPAGIYFWELDGIFEDGSSLTSDNKKGTFRLIR